MLKCVCVIYENSIVDECLQMFVFRCSWCWFCVYQQRTASKSIINVLYHPNLAYNQLLYWSTCLASLGLLYRTITYSAMEYIAVKTLTPDKALIHPKVTAGATLWENNNKETSFVDYTSSLHTFMKLYSVCPSNILLYPMYTVPCVLYLFRNSVHTC